MKHISMILLVGWIGLGPLPAGTLEDARRALADGQAQVAIHRLQRQEGRWTDAAERREADLLLGQALFAAGRYQEGAGRLVRIAESEPEAAFWLAESYLGLNEPEKALPVFLKLAALPAYASRAAIGQSRALRKLWREQDALNVLEERVRVVPGDEAAALEWAEAALDAGQPETAAKALALVRAGTARANYARGRVLLARGEATQARAVFETISTCPARMAAGLAISRAECELLLADPAAAERFLEAFIEENFALPGLAEVFASLDRAYAAQSSASSTELRRWAEDAGQPLRAGYALFYLARNEERAGNPERGRRLFEQFLEKYPGNPLGEEARIELAASRLREGNPGQALELLESESGGSVWFLRGRALSAQRAYREAAEAFLEAAEESPFEREALANAALCLLMAGVPDQKNEAAQRLAGLSDGGAAFDRFTYLSALSAAARRDPEAGDRLKRLAESDSPHAVPARLALAEWDALRLDREGAREQLRLVSAQGGGSPAVEERAAALAVFVADDGTDESETEVRRLAERFLEAWPDSAFAPEIHLKLGEMHFRRGDYLAARGEFVTVAEKFPNSPLAEKAVFLTARAMERSMDPATMLEAIELYETVASKGGTLAGRARLAQALLFNALGKPKDALGVFEKILESQPDPELRATALIESGETHYALGANDPAGFQRAIATWNQLADDPSATRLWTNQARFRIGSAYEKLNQPDAALDAYYSVVSGGPTDGKPGSEPEYFWYYKAGFEAGNILESRKLWKEAIALYEKLAAVDGPRAREAEEKVKKLRLANFLWEE